MEGKPMTTPKTTGPTPPRQFRLSDETIATIDALAAKLGLSGRAEVIRHAITRLAAAELAPRKNSKKSAE
jgi:metal-responsive CopG/Arc/MetJ family transcriptional regulator